MTNLVLEVYDAFNSVGIDDDMARKAAGALSDNPKQIADLRTEMIDQFAELRIEMNGRFESARAETNARFESAKVEVNGRFDNVDKRFDKLQADVSALRSEQLVIRTMFVLLMGGVASLVLKAFF